MRLDDRNPSAFPLCLNAGLRISRPSDNNRLRRDGNVCSFSSHLTDSTGDRRFLFGRVSATWRLGMFRIADRTAPAGTPGDIKPDRPAKNSSPLFIWVS